MRSSPHIALRRVAVTGIGLVTPVGNDRESAWDALLAGRSGIGSVTRFDAGALTTRIAGEVRAFDPSGSIGSKDIKKTDLFAQFAIVAADEALADAGRPHEALDRSRVGVIVGAGMGGIATIEHGVATYRELGPRRVSPFFIPKLIANMAPGQIAIQHGLRGVNYAPASACASGAHAIGEAFRLIRFGLQDAMIAGGAEAGVTPMCLAGFSSMKALSRRNDEPARASRPFDRDRDGFVVGEGAGLLVLEELSAAISRGARIYAEMVGYGANADAYHITTPSPDGEGAADCMRLALAEANAAPERVAYINAHGTATEYNDVNETQAIKKVFGAHAGRLAISSTKSMTGHALGAAGGIEAAITALSVARGVVPPTANLDHPDPACDLDYVASGPRTMAVGLALSNSFGFGGANACLAFARATTASVDHEGAAP